MWMKRRIVVDEARAANQLRPAGIRRGRSRGRTVVSTSRPVPPTLKKTTTTTAMSMLHSQWRQPQTKPTEEDEVECEVCERRIAPGTGIEPMAGEFKKDAKTGERYPICYSYHTDCYKCWICNRNMVSDAIHIRQVGFGVLACAECRSKAKGKACSAADCQQPITLYKTVVDAIGQSWHRQCWRCGDANCRHTLPRMQKPLVASVVEVYGKPYHKQCVRCNFCSLALVETIELGKPAGNQEIKTTTSGRVKGGGRGKTTVFACDGCYLRVRFPSCYSCRKPIVPTADEGMKIRASGRSYHKACFTCIGCLQPLADNFVTVNGDHYCEECSRLAKPNWSHPHKRTRRLKKAKEIAQRADERMGAWRSELKLMRSRVQKHKRRMKEQQSKAETGLLVANGPHPSSLPDSFDPKQPTTAIGPVQRTTRENRKSYPPRAASNRRRQSSTATKPKPKTT